MDGRILAADHDGAYVLKLVGDVRVNLCSSIDDYLDQMFTDPGFESVFVDLCDAQGIDSTTLGLLAKLALTVKERFGFQPAIYSCDPGINRLIKSMGFQRLFELREEVCGNPEEAVAIPAVEGSESEVKDKVIEAHKVLMELSSENRARFKDLLTALERG